MISVQIDTREKDSYVSALASELDKNGISWTRFKLSVGDIAILKDDNVICIIEHKSFSDFVSSIKNGHLESQLFDMDKADCLQYVFIDGTYQNWVKSPNYTYSKLGVDNINGYKIKAQSIHKAHIVQFDTTAQYCRGVCLLCKQLERERVKGVQLPERTISTGNHTLDLLLTIDGLGIKKAQDILDSGLSFVYLYAVCHRLEPDVARDLIKAEFNVTVPIKSIEYISTLK